MIYHLSNYTEFSMGRPGSQRWIEIGTLDNGCILLIEKDNGCKIVHSRVLKPKNI